MLEITYSQLRNPILVDGVRRLYGYDRFKDIPSAYEVQKTCKNIDKKLKEINDGLELIVDKYAEVNADGTRKTHEGKEGTYIVPDDKVPDYTAERNLFLETTAKIEGAKVDVEEIKFAKLSPAHLEAMEGLLDV